ncbi:MAG: hypothetical protein ED559_05450 [Phycisphaera sp.]|nr:MAG: hypothetical protein ED559_05450 [Phycisphaera sp.]
MNVLLDENPIDVQDETLAGAMNAAVEAAEKQGRTIIEVVLDGQPVRGEALENVSTTPIPDSSVEFVSADPVALVQQSLFDASQALAATQRAHSDIADMLQGGEDVPKAMNKLGETLNVWQGAQDVLARGYALLNIDPATISLPKDIAGGKPVTSLFQDLGEQLREVRRSIEDHDLASLADAIGYELEPLAGEWAKVLAFAAETLVKP